MTFIPEQRQFSGTPIEDDIDIKYEITVRATNKFNSVTDTFTIDLYDPPPVVNTSLPSLQSQFLEKIKDPQVNRKMEWILNSPFTDINDTLTYRGYYKLEPLSTSTRRDLASTDWTKFDTKAPKFS